MTPLLWGVLPYVVLALLVAGLIWRHRYDTFGWTTRPSIAPSSTRIPPTVSSPAAVPP
ncbi:respiratory nitrate reductase subunit gamma [Streptomyces sp. NPDC054837]